MLQGLLTAGLAGCTTGSPTLDLFSRGAQDLAGRGPSSYPLTRAQIESIPYATMGARLGQQAAVVTVLAYYKAGGLQWTSSDNVSFVTKAGRLVQTVGLSRDLQSTRWQGDTDPLAQGLQLLSSGTSTAERIIDLQHPDAANLSYQSRFSEIGPEKITILEHEYSTVHIEESVQASAGGWSCQNHYWLDSETGFVWRSNQQYCGEVPPIRFEVLKPPDAAT